MLSISTANLVSAVALGSMLTGFVLPVAVGPRVNSVKCGGEDPLLEGGHLCTRELRTDCGIAVNVTSTTCNCLAEEWNITVAEFVQYNYNVDPDCDNLVIGQYYCVLIGSIILDECYPGNTNPLCQQ